MTNGQLRDRPFLVAAAMDAEMRGIRTRLTELRREKTSQGAAWSGLWKGHPLLMLRTGVGPEKAGRALSALLKRFPCRGILSIGYAGALNRELRVGDLVIPGEILAVPPLEERVYASDKTLFGQACQVARSGRWPCQHGRMLTVDRVVAASAEKERLGRAHRAWSVEMESASLAAVAEKASIPFVVVRVILDEAALSFPDVTALGRLWRRRKILRLAREAVSRPGDLLKLVRLGIYARKAGGRLDRFLLEGLLDVLVPC